MLATPRSAASVPVVRKFGVVAISPTAERRQRRSRGGVATRRTADGEDAGRQGSRSRDIGWRDSRSHVEFVSDFIGDTASIRGRLTHSTRHSLRIMPAEATLSK